MVETTNNGGVANQNATDHSDAFTNGSDRNRPNIVRSDRGRQVTDASAQALIEAANAQRLIQRKYSEQLQEIANLIASGNINLAKDRMTALINLERDESIGKMTDQRSLEMGQASVGQLFKKFGQALQGIGEAWGLESVAEFGAKLSSVPDGRAFLEYNAIQADLSGLNALEVTLRGQFTGPVTDILPTALAAARGEVGLTVNGYNAAGRGAGRTETYVAPAGPALTP